MKENKEIKNVSYFSSFSATLQKASEILIGEKNPQP